MIVRDAAAALPACLASVAPLVDELVVVDTGSRDETPALARAAGARVVRVEWRDDFAAARNAYLAAARGDWILSLDADEVLGRVATGALRALVQRAHGAALACTIRSHTPAGCVVSRTVRLFPRARGVAYSFPVHESLLPALSRVGIPVRQCGLPIHHLGYLDGRGRLPPRAELYRDLGLRKVQRFPRHARGHLELARVLAVTGEHERAAQAAARCLQLDPTCGAARRLLADLTCGARSRPATPA